jgi:hypothetical protein
MRRRSRPSLRSITSASGNVVGMPFPAFAAHSNPCPIRAPDPTPEVPVAFSRVRRLLLILVILSATVLSRFGINLGTYSLNFSLIAIYVLIGFELLSGNLMIDPRRLFAYYICVAVASTSFLVNKGFGHIDRAS